MTALHIHAQDAAIFAITMFVVIGIAIWLDMRKEEKEDRVQGVCPPCNHNCNQGRDCPARRV